MCRTFISCVILSTMSYGSIMAESHIEKSITNAISRLDATNVLQIVICQENDVEADPFADSSCVDEEHLLPLSTITNRVVVDSLVADLKVALHNRLPVEKLPFSGILSYQVFVTKESSFLVTHVVLGEEGFLAVSEGRQEKKGFCLTGADMVLLESPSFADAVQHHMKTSNKSLSRCEPLGATLKITNGDDHETAEP